MNRTASLKRTSLNAALLIAALLSVALPAPAQTRQTSARRAQARAERGIYTPKLKGSSPSYVVEGQVVAISSSRIAIKTRKGVRYVFGLDDLTTVIESGELVSIATLADVALSASDLRVFDQVEIVTGREPSGDFARIITRLDRGGQVAKR
jgi:hypothetical protein